MNKGLFSRRALTYVFGGLLTGALLFGAVAHTEALNVPFLKPTTLVGQAVASHKIDTSPWHGKSSGYVASSETTKETAYLMAHAKVYSAIGEYRKFAAEARKANTAVMEVFWKVEAVSSLRLALRDHYASIAAVQQEKNSESVASVLAQLATPESIMAYTDSRLEKRSEFKKIEELLNRVEYAFSDDAFESYSLESVMQAASGLLRQAGELLEQAVSAQGHVLDKRAFVKARALIAATQSVKLADHLDFCETGDLPAKRFSDSLQVFAQSLESQSAHHAGFGLNAGDAYQLAGQALEIGKSSEANDSSCAGQFMISQSQ